MRQDHTFVLVALCLVLIDQLIFLGGDLLDGIPVIIICTVQLHPEARGMFYQLLQLCLQLLCSDDVVTVVDGRFLSTKSTCYTLV
jgi:hypothetical protein